MYLLNVFNRRKPDRGELAVGIVMAEQIVPMLESIQALAGVCKDIADAMGGLTAEVNELQQHLKRLQERMDEVEE